MPRIPEYIADCAIYLYGSEDAARKGQEAGGSGFLVHIPSADRHTCHLYAVTNKHLVDDNFTALRLNRKGGDTDCIVTKPDDWFLHPDGDDVAVYPLNPHGDFKWNSVPLEAFADRECMGIYNLGYGDDVFLIGRLMVQSGRQKNTPVVRFGNISLGADPAEPIKYNNRDQEAYLVECRSISGFSGSPVFIQVERWYSGDEATKVWEFRQRKHPTNNNEKPPLVGTTSLGFPYLPWQVNVGPLLLGIDFGHLPHWNDVFQFPANKKRRATEYKAQSNTGIAGVVPSWKIVDVLNNPKLVEERTKEDKKLKKQVEKNSDTFVLDSAREPAESTFTQQDFEADLEKVTRRVKPSESDEGTK